jgi:hypothetical protein
MVPCLPSPFNTVGVGVILTLLLLMTFNFERCTLYNGQPLKPCCI